MDAGGSGFFDSESNIIALVAGGGGILILIILLLLVLFCITTILLCKILRRLQFIQPATGSENTSDKVTTVAKEHVEREEETGDSSDVPPHIETKLSNSQSVDHIPPEHDPTGEAMYATISEEHREKKKMAKLTVQQYDDINLLTMEGGGGGEDMTTQNEHEMKLVSVTMEEDDGGYSRLIHAGPRMKETKKHIHSSSISTKTDTQQQQQPQRKMSKKEDVSASVSAAPTTSNDDKQYSEIQPVRPHSKLIVPSTTGSYSLIAADDNEPSTPPTLPKRTRSSTIINTIETPSTEQVEDSNVPVPYQNVPKSDTLDPNEGSGYSVVGRPAAPCVMDTSFFDDVIEFRNKKAQETLGTEKLYAVMN